MISISGLDKAAVLAALYNASRPQGMGFMQFDPKPMTADEGRNILFQANVPARCGPHGGSRSSVYFDYLKGRVMKVDLSSDDQFDERLYDRDNGQGAAARAIESVRASRPRILTVMSSTEKTRSKQRPSRKESKGEK